METQYRAEFAELLGQMMELFGRELTESAARLWWGAFKDLPFEVVANGISQYIRHGKYPPKPGDVRELIESAARSEWPTAEEAWAGAQDAADEDRTVVWTLEAGKAFHDVAEPLLSSGDHVSARMAFKDAYERLVREAIASGRRPEWKVVRGWDVDHRRVAVEKALEDGRITPKAAEPILIETDRQMSDDASAVAGLITGKVDPQKSPPPHDALREIFDQLAKAPENTKARQARQRREEIERRREMARRGLSGGEAEEGAA